MHQNHLLPRFACVLVLMSVSLLPHRALGGIIVYDTIDGSVDPTKWTTVGTVTETNNRFNVWGTVSNVGTTSIAASNNNVNGAPLLGFRSSTVISNPSGGLTASATGYIEFTNDSDFIRFQYENVGNGWRISSNGIYGANSNIGFVLGEQLSSPEVRPDGNDLLILSNNVELHRFTNTQAAPNSFFRFYVQGINGSGGENYTAEGAGNPSNGLGLASSSTIVGFYVADELAAVPEPSSLALLATGTFGLFGYGWRRKRKQAA